MVVFLAKTVILSAERLQLKKKGVGMFNFSSANMLNCASLIWSSGLPCHVCHGVEADITNN